MVPPVPVRLRGRQVQRETLRRRLDAVQAGQGSVVLIQGLAGMGKSALLAEAAGLAQDRGIRAFTAAGDAASQVIPLGVLLEALVPAEDPPVDPAVLRDLSQSPDQRFWLLRELQEALERAALRAPLLIAVDDVQWADPATLVALGTLPRHLAPHRILWLLAVRSGEHGPAVRAALAAGLITERGDWLAFRHDLVREAVEASLPRTVRQSLRRTAVDVLLRHGAPPADVAELVMKVAQPGDATAIAVLRQAATATGRVSPTVAGLLSRRALDLSPPGDPGRGPLTAETISYLVHAGQAAEALRLMTTGAADLTDPTAEAEARLSLAILSMQYAPADVIEQCRRALDRPGVPAALRVQLLSFLALGFDLNGDVGAAEKPAREAVREARANRDGPGEVITLVPRAAYALATGDWGQATGLIGQAVTRRPAPAGASPAARLGLPDAWMALIFTAGARLDEAFALIDAGLQAAQRDGIAANVRIWSMLRGRALLSAGRLADAQAEAEATLEMADEIGDGSYGYVNHMGRYVLGQVALHTGDADGLAQARRAGDRLRGTPACPSSQDLGAWLLAQVTYAEGDAAAAVRAAEPALDPLARGPLPASSPRTYADTAALVRMLLAAGRPAAAASVTGRLADFARQHPDFPFLDSAALHARAVLNGDYAAADRAAELSAADPRPLVRAAILEDAGRLRPAGQAAEAVRLLEDALAAYSAAGAGRDAARVRSLLRTRGVRPPPTGPRSAPAWPELTESELAVVTLVAQGATNRAVAERLYLSPYTVNSHLRHVFAKLGIRSRVELARLAAERGTHR
jgi:DNA-binding CsgD family transcriptional regulator